MAPYSVVVVADPSELAGFRRRFGIWLAASGLRDAVVTDLVLAAHEALAYAIEGSGPSDFVKLRASVSAEAVTIVVTSEGPWQRTGTRRTSSTSGLDLVRALVAQVSLSTDQAKTALTMHQPLVSAAPSADR